MWGSVLQLLQKSPGNPSTLSCMCAWCLCVFVCWCVLAFDHGVVLVFVYRCFIHSFHQRCVRILVDPIKKTFQGLPRTSWRTTNRTTERRPSWYLRVVNQSGQKETEQAGKKLANHSHSIQYILQPETNTKLYYIEKRERERKNRQFQLAPTTIINIQGSMYSPTILAYVPSVYVLVFLSESIFYSPFCVGISRIFSIFV